MTHHFISLPRKWSRLLLFAGLTLFFAYISWCTPFTGDDLEFASLQYESVGEYITYVCQYGNGRFLGNLLAVSMPYLPLVRIWAKAIVLASCVMLFPLALGQNSLSATLFSFLLFVGVDETLFANVYAWASGFSNYITPVWLTLIIQCVLNKRTGILRKNSLKVCIIFPLAVCAQLFMEHTTAINLLLSLWAVVRGSREEDSPRGASWAWLAGSCVGLAIMVFGPGLFYVADNHTSTYRGFCLDSILDVIVSCVRNALRLSTFYLNTNSIPLCFGCAATIYLSRDRRSAKGNRTMAMLWGLCSIFIAFCACHSLDNYFGNNNFLYHALGLSVVLLLIGIWLVAIWQLGKGVLRERLLFCLVFGLISLAPLLIVHPLPIRVVFQSYIFFAAAAMLCAGALGKKLDLRWLTGGKAVALLVAVVYVLNLSFVYSFIAHASKLREDYILEQIDLGAASIDVFTIEYGYLYDTYMDALAVAYYEKIAGHSLTFHEISQTSWMGYHG